MGRLLTAAVVCLAALTTASACTSSVVSPKQTAGPTPSRRPAPIASATPIAQGAVTTRDGTCPLASKSTVKYTGGVRVGRITVQRAAGRVVGCTFYGLQHPDAQCDQTCLSGENLPGPNQPVVEVTLTRYRSALATRSAVATIARAGRNPQRQSFGSLTGACFTTDFDPHDHGTDWACVVGRGDTMLLVRTVLTSGGQLSSSELTQKVLDALPA